MKKQQKLRPTSKRMLFDPDALATLIHQAVQLDYSKAQHEYCLKSDTMQHFAFNRQCNELLKKYCSPTQDQQKLEEETFEKFFEVNSHILETNIRLIYEFENMPQRIQHCETKVQEHHLRARAIVNFVLGSFSVEELFLEAKHSPGSTLGVGFVDTSPEAKFQLPMTATKRVVPYMTEYLSFDSQLKEAVQTWTAGAPVSGWYDVVDGSRASTVDKTTEKRRMICVEPTANMFLQQGLMQMMIKRLRKVGLDVASLPDRHKLLARLSSVSGQNATIDWSSASDTVSIELLRWLLPPKWFDIVWDLRCDTASFNKSAVELQMISTMGNAVTFPLETLVFWAYATAVTLSRTKSKSLFPDGKQLRQNSVFGDDCIVPTANAEEFISVMHAVGFIINQEKSFYGSEQFRESCGGDYLAGYDVRPYSLKAPTSSSKSALAPWLNIIGNSLIKKYISYYGELSYVYDREAFKCLFELYRQNGLEIMLVPDYFPDDAGLKISSDLLRFQLSYPMKLSRIDKSKHGTYRFRYLRFRYWNTEATSADIRYSLWLKQPVTSPPGSFTVKMGKDRRPYSCDREELEIHGVRLLRKRGGYVVAKAISSHWEVPVVNRP
jgi:hypothetical protein